MRKINQNVTTRNAKNASINGSFAYRKKRDVDSTSIESPTIRQKLFEVSIT